MPTVRVTWWPDTDLEVVDEQEVASLRAMGVLIETPTDTESAPESDKEVNQ